MKKYLRHKATNLVVVDEICALEYRNHSGIFSKEVDNHDFWELCFVESGTMRCKIDGHDTLLNEQEMIFIPPNTPHEYEQNERTSVFCICFTCISPYLKPLGLQSFKTTYEQRNALFNLQRESRNAFANNKEEQLIQLNEQKLGGMQILIIQLEYIILLALRELVESKNSPLVILRGGDFYTHLIEKIKQFCKEKVSKKLSLDEICKNIGYSRSFTCKLFKEVTGESIFTYFNKLKIEEAKKLLSSTENSATQISEMLEFTDAKYFNTLFRKIVGTSPLNYKKQVKKEMQKSQKSKV